MNERIQVVTHSSGNHAQALALAAQIRKIPVRTMLSLLRRTERRVILTLTFEFELQAYIVMPRDCPQPKLAAVRDRYVVACGAVTIVTISQQHRFTLSIAQLQSKRVLMRAYNDSPGRDGTSKGTQRCILLDTVTCSADLAVLAGTRIWSDVHSPV